MVRKACDPVTPSLEKSLSKNRENLDNTYQELFHNFSMNKAEADEDINVVDEHGDSKYQHNDAWIAKIETEYYEIVDISDVKLEFLAKKSSGDSGQEA